MSKLQSKISFIMKSVIVIFATCLTLVLGVTPKYHDCLKRFNVNKQVYPNEPPGPFFSDRERYCAQACAWEDLEVWYPDGTLYQDLKDTDISPIKTKARFYSEYNACKDEHDNCKRIECMVKLDLQLRNDDTS